MTPTLDLGPNVIFVGGMRVCSAVGIDLTLYGTGICGCSWYNPSSLLGQRFFALTGTNPSTCGSDPKVGGDPKSRTKCALHAAEELAHFCKRCFDLSCAILLKQNAHASHPSDLLSITEAADNARKECYKTGTGTGDGGHAKLTMFTAAHCLIHSIR